MNKPIAVCIVTNNLHWETRYVIENLVSKTNLKVKLYILDNASTNPKTIDLGREMCIKTKGLFLSFLGQPHRISTSLNHIMDHVTEDRIVLFPVNCFVHKNWLEDLIHFSETIKNVGALSIRSKKDNLELVPLLHENITAVSDELKHTWISKNNTVDGLIFFKKELIDKVGFLDESFKNTGTEIIEWLFRLSLTGYQNAYITNQSLIKLNHLENGVIFPPKSKAAINELKTEVERMIKVQTFKK